MAQRILVFESDPDFAGDVQQGFERLGANVDVVADGTLGLERAAEKKPDLILLSIELPSMNGFLVCKKIKKDNSLKDIPLVILSSDANADEIFEQHKKLRTRAEDYVKKPVGFDELLERVQRLIPISAEPAAQIDETGEEPMEIAAEDVVIDEGAPANVDEEIDAFAESAFGALVMEPTDATTVAAVPHVVKGHSPAERRMPPSTAPEPVAAPAPAKRAEKADKSGPAPMPTDGASAELRAELDRAKRQLADMEEELRSAKSRAADADRLERDLAELKAKAGKSGGISSREFLELREALNKKDKEILDYKDQISARDKQVVEARDKSLSLERGRADLEDKILELEKELEDARDKIISLGADKDSATKRAEDMRQRAERAEAKGKKLETELEDERRGRAGDVERLKSERDEAVNAARAKADADAARAAAAHQAEIERLRSEMEGAARLAEDQRQQETTALREAHATALRESQERAAAELAAAQASHEEASARARADSEARRERELEALRSELTGEMERRLAEAESRRQGELAQAAQERETALAELRQQLETKAAAEAKAADDKHGREMAVLGRKMAETENRLAMTTERLEDTEQTKTQLETDLASTTTERNTLRAELEDARGRITGLERLKQEHEERIADLENAVRELEGKLNAATRKIAGDEQLLERARKALTIGLALLEDQKNNAVEETQTS